MRGHSRDLLTHGPRTTMACPGGPRRGHTHGLERVKAEDQARGAGAFTTWDAPCPAIPSVSGRAGGHLPQCRFDVALLLRLGHHPGWLQEQAAVAELVQAAPRLLWISYPNSRRRGLCVLSVSRYPFPVTGAIAHVQAEQLRSALDGVLRELVDSRKVSSSAREAFFTLIDVLESSSEAVVLASNSVLSTQQAAELLGVSRMTVVRLVDRGELAIEGGGVHRRISASELARYRVAAAARRTAGLHALTQEIDGRTPPDEVVRTR